MAGTLRRANAAGAAVDRRSQQQLHPTISSIISRTLLHAAVAAASWRGRIGRPRSSCGVRTDQRQPLDHADDSASITMTGHTQASSPEPGTSGSDDRGQQELSRAG
jgi:hypothetical protein